MRGILDGFTHGTQNSWKIVAGRRGNRGWSGPAVVLFLGASCAFGQINLSLSSGSAVAGGTVSLDLSLNAVVGNQPVALQWTYIYSATDVTPVGVVAGPAAVAAGKSISCRAGAGSYTCLFFGLNTETIADGVVATATFTVSPTTLSTSSTIQIVDHGAAAASGNSVNVAATGGLVTISSPFTLTALACVPADLTTAGSASCTVGLSAAAPTGGLTVTIGTGAGVRVSVPSSVTVAAGLTSAEFTVSAPAVSTSTRVILFASLNQSSRSLSLTLVPDPPPLGLIRHH